MKRNHEELLNQAQLYQTQIQNLLAQKEAFSLQLMEINRALEELEKNKDKEVFKISGPILLKRPSGEVLKDLKGKKELVEVRLKALEKEERDIKLKIEEIRKSIVKDQAVGG